MQINKLIDWLQKQKKINKLKIKKKNINHLKDWIFKKNLISHKTKNFFSIKPFLFERKNKKIFQPLIIQKEEGILGIIKQKRQGKNYYLLQSKIEPGNINGVQISPTVGTDNSHTIDINSATFTDEYGVNNDASTQFTWNYDGTGPFMDISASAVSNFNTLKQS